MSLLSSSFAKEEIEHSIQAKDLKKLFCLLVNYGEEDTHHQFQQAYRLCLEQKNVQQFSQFYISRKGGKRVLPDQKLLSRLLAVSVEIFMADFCVEVNFRQLTSDVFRAIFEMLVLQGMIEEFLEYYRDINGLSKVPGHAEPDSGTIGNAIGYLKYLSQSQSGDPQARVKAEKMLERLSETFKLRI